MTNEPYKQWLAKRREETPPATLTDQIMSRVVELDHQRQTIWRLRLMRRIEESRVSRWAVCGSALAVGSLPFVFLAYVAKFVTFGGE